MAKTYNRKLADEAFRRITGVGDDDDSAVGESVDSPPENTIQTPPPKKNLIQNSDNEDNTKNKNNLEPGVRKSETLHNLPSVPRENKTGKKTKFIHKSWYVLPEHEKALKRRAYLDDSLDMSGHVRAALELYLQKDLAAIKNGED